jgi:hypothetical protein
MWTSIVGLLCVVLGVMFGREILSRGYAQRLNFLTYFAWVLGVSVVFVRQPGPSHMK